MKILKDFNVDLNTNEILRQLKSKNSDERSREAPASLLKEVEELKLYAKTLIRPRAIYDIFDSKELTPRFLFKKSEKTVFAICTIGKEAETHVADLLRKGELAKGAILNGIASHAAEQAAEYTNQHILENLTEEVRGKEITNRFSPGYCQWELDKGQQSIFKYLEGSKVGVNLTSSMMMNPVKSVSFAINIGTEIDSELGIRDCENCGLKNCAFRRN